MNIIIFNKILSSYYFMIFGLFLYKIQYLYTGFIFIGISIGNIITLIIYIYYGYYNIAYINEQPDLELTPLLVSSFLSFIFVINGLYVIVEYINNLYTSCFLMGIFIATIIDSNIIYSRI